MKNNLLILLLLAACASKPKENAIAPNTKYSLEQVGFTSPDATDWYLFQKTLHLLVLARKPLENGDTTLLMATMFPAGTHKTAKEFLSFIEKERKRGDDRHDILQQKNTYVTFKGLPCLHYETISSDKLTTKFLKTYGYVCRYPLEYIAFQFEISDRSNLTEILGSDLKIADKFFEKMELVPATIQRLKTIK